MPRSAQSKGIMLFPIREDFSDYGPATFRADLIAGFNVALLAVPQAMAYALLAGLPLSAGLLSAFIGTVLAACFGSSRHLIIGPTNATAILIQAATADILFTHYRGVSGPEHAQLALQVLMQLALLIGGLQVLAGSLGLGRLVQFVSRSVVVGYVNGAVCAILLGQLFVVCGVGRLEGTHSLLAQGWHLCAQWGSYHGPTLVVGAVGLLLLLVFKSLPLRALASVLMLLATSYLAMYGGQHFQGLRLVGDFGSVSTVLPPFDLPYLSLPLLGDILPHAFAIALLGVLEASSVGKAVAVRSGQNTCINQQIFGMGLCNVFASCIGAMPASGSALRSFLNFDSGAKTRLSAVFSGLWVGLIWAALGGVVVHIPLASLSAILFVTACTMIDWQLLRRCVWATGPDAAVVLVTTVAALIMSLDVAFYTGVFLSLAFHLRGASKPRIIDHSMSVIRELLRTDTSRTIPGTRVVEMASELFFGSADLLEAELISIIEQEQTQILILRLRNVYGIDATACLTIERLHARLDASNKRLLLCDVTAPVMAVLRDSGVANLFAVDELFIQDSVYPTLSLENALASLVQDSEPAAEPAPVLTATI